MENMAKSYIHEIPEGYEARIEGNKVIIELAESEDERIINAIIGILKNSNAIDINVSQEKMFAWLEKQKECVADNSKTSADEDEKNWKIVMEYVKDDALRNWLEKQKENPKSADSIPADCTSDVKCENSWHKVADSLPDNPREVLCKDEAGNFFIGRYYVGEGWEISNYDDEDKPHHLNPPVSKWIDFPSEKQKEQKSIIESKRLANEVIEYLTRCGYSPVLKDDSKKEHFHIDIPRHEDDFWHSEEYKHCRSVLGEYYMEGDYGGDTYTLYVWREKKEQKPDSTEDMPYITDEHFYEREPADSFKYELAEYMTKCCTKKEGPDGYTYGISAESILKMAEEELLKRGVVQKPAEWSEEDEKDLGWISVKDRLPEENKWVFVCVDMQGVPQCVGLGYLKDEWWCDDENDNGFCVDYWMEIPKLPKEEGE